MIKFDFFNKSFLFLVFILPLTFILGPATWNINFFLLSVISIIIIVINFRIFKDKIYGLRYFYTLFLIFCCYLIFNSIVSVYTEDIISRSISYMRFFLIVLAVPFVLKVEDKFFTKYTKFFFIILSISILVVCFSAFAELLRLDIPIYTKSDVNYRLNGPFGDEAIVGAYLFFFFPSFLFISKMLRVNNLLIIPITLFSVYIIFASGERMVILMTIGFVISYLILRTNNITKIISYSFIILTIIFCFFTYITSQKSDINSNILKNEKGNEYSYDFRLNQTLKEFKDPFNTSYFIHFKTAYMIFNNHKIFGSGFRTFRYECYDKKYDSIGYLDEIRCRTHPHNVHLELLSDTGIVGYLLLNLTLFSFIILYIKNSYSKNTLYLLIPILLFIFPIRTSGSFFASIYGGLFWYQFLILMLFEKKNLIKIIK